MSTFKNILKEVKNLANEDIRKKIKLNNVKYWQVADEYGITDGNFSKKLRKELSEAEKSKIFSIIEKIVKTRKEA